MVGRKILIGEVTEEIKEENKQIIDLAIYQSTYHHHLFIIYPILKLNIQMIILDPNKITVGYLLKC